MDRTSKLAILAWAIAALLIECYYVSGAWPTALWLGPLLLVASAVGARLDRRVVAPVLATAYVFPVLVYLASGRYNVLTSVLWLAPLLGVTLPDGLGRGWQVPVRWRVPLACWAAGVAATAPIIALRAVDFRSELLFRGRLPYESLGGLPLLTVGWTLHVALVLVIGVLWFDWLCGLDEPFLVRWVAAPMAAGAAILSLVAVYQMLVDVSFLNPTVYAGIQRASATMMDANVGGVLAAMWIGGSVALAARMGRPVLAVPAVVVLWCAVWATGSRTAFASAAIVSLISAVAFRTRASSRRVLVAAAFGILLVSAILFGPGRHNSRVVGPIARVMSGMPAMTQAGIREAVEELWNRNGYGLAATRAIRAYPAFGIGVGAFHEMAAEFGGWLPPDNAQNWYRHQLVELGVVGSIGWMLFVLSFGFWMCTRHQGEQPAAWALRASILAIAAISLLGMPGQDPTVSITFWTMCAWFLAASARPASVRLSAPRWAWLAALTVVIAFTVGTALSAMGPLRLPVRIQRAGGDYLYGFYWPEPDGEGGEYRWARKVATAVVPVESRVVELTLRVNHSDLAAHPTHVKAWVNGRKVIDATLTSGSDSVTVPVLLPQSQARMVVDTETSRVVKAPPPDGRELGVMVRWRFRQSSR